MGVSTMRRRLRMPPLDAGFSLGADDRAHRRRVPRHVRLLLRLGIGMLIVLLLLCVLWVEPVTSRYLAT